MQTLWLTCGSPGPFLMHTDCPWRMATKDGPGRISSLAPLGQLSWQPSLPHIWHWESLPLPRPESPGTDGLGSPLASESPFLWHCLGGGNGHPGMDAGMGRESGVRSALGQPAGTSQVPQSPASIQEGTTRGGGGIALHSGLSRACQAPGGRRRAPLPAFYCQSGKQMVWLGTLQESLGSPGRFLGSFCSALLKGLSG